MRLARGAGRRPGRHGARGTRSVRQAASGDRACRAARGLEREGSTSGTIRRTRASRSTGTACGSSCSRARQSAEPARRAPPRRSGARLREDAEYLDALARVASSGSPSSASQAARRSTRPRWRAPAPDRGAGRADRARRSRMRSAEGLLEARRCGGGSRARRNRARRSTYRDGSERAGQRSLRRVRPMRRLRRRS